MTRYMISSIRSDDLKDALKQMETVLSEDLYRQACVDTINALGGRLDAPAMIRYLINQETERLSNPQRPAG